MAPIVAPVHRVAEPRALPIGLDLPAIDQQGPLTPDQVELLAEIADYLDERMRLEYGPC
jgi:hypothetical protein